MVISQHLNVNSLKRQPRREKCDNENLCLGICFRVHFHNKTLIIHMTIFFHVFIILQLILLQLMKLNHAPNIFSKKVEICRSARAFKNHKISEILAVVFALFFPAFLPDMLHLDSEVSWGCCVAVMKLFEEQ